MDRLITIYLISFTFDHPVPRETHRYIIEPSSETPHIKSVMKTFLEQIRKSTKLATKSLLNTILLDSRSTTGSNLLNILLRMDKSSMHDLVPSDDTTIDYHPIHLRRYGEYHLSMISLK